MTHIVIHDDSSKVRQYAEFDDVQAAASYLEDLVNGDGGSNARLFSLEPVEFAVKSYVRVEIAGSAPVATDTGDGGNEVEDSVGPVVDASDGSGAPEVDTVEYVEAVMSSPDAFAAVTSPPDVVDGPTSGEPRRGLFGR